MNHAALPDGAPSANPATQEKQLLLLSILAGLIAALVRGIGHFFAVGNLFVGSYWVDFYLTNYRDGFRRRALIGSIVRLFAPNGIDVRWINLIAFLTVFTLAAIYLRAMLRLSRTGPRERLFAFAFFASSLLSVYFEVLGDTLQIALLIFVAIALIPARLTSNPFLRTLLWACGVSIAFLIHEASIFFLIPCVPFLSRQRPRLRDFLLPTTFLLCLLGVSLHWSELNPHLTYRVFPYPRNRVFVSESLTPNFHQLLGEEKENYFGSRSALLAFADKCLSVASITFAGLIALTVIFPRQAMQRILSAFTVIFLFLIPLWCIAHDWGRFLGYAFFLAVVVASLPERSHPASDTVRPSSLAVKAEAWLRRLSLDEFVAFAVLLLLFSSPFATARSLVLMTVEMQCFLALLFLAILVHRTQHASQIIPD